MTTGLTPFKDFSDASAAVLASLQRLLGFECWLVTRREGEYAQIVHCQGGLASLSEGARYCWKDSLCARMVDDLHPQLIPDLAQKPGYRNSKQARTLGLGAYLGAPIYHLDGSLFGSLCAFDRSPQPVGITDFLPIIQWAARLLSTLLVCDRRAQDEAKLLVRIHQIEQQLEGDAEQLLQRIKTQDCLYKLDQLGQESLTRADFLMRAVRLLPEGWIDSVQAQIELEGVRYQSEHFKRTLWYEVAPLRVDDHQVGEVRVCFCQPRAPVSPEPLAKEHHLLIALAHRISAILERKHIEQALRESEARFEQMSRSDGLTGLLNRRGWNLCIAEEEQRAQRYGHPACVVILDLDGLKMVNDQKGHKAGDLMIQQAARALRTAVREVDQVARIGGDEFAILAVECSELHHQQLQQRLSDALSEQGVGASWGIAQCALSHQLSKTIAEADRRMYQMKALHHAEQGRGC